MAGRWLAAEQPAITSPADRTRETCAAWVALVMRAGIGDYAQRRVGLAGRVGRRLAPATVAGYVGATRTFFRDCQEWGWCARRFDPSTALATPRSVLAVLGPKPRVIADDAWAKILWAGLNLTVEDLGTAGTRAYPLELVRALALTWLFAAQRSDEIARLRVGCIRWQPPGDDPAAEPVCLLDIPVHLTALTLRAVFRLAYRQTEGLIGSIMRLLGLISPCRTTPPCAAGQPPWRYPGHGRATPMLGARPSLCICWWTARA